MDKYMESLIKTLNMLGQPSWLDYLQVIASVTSIIISAWAVIMAISVPNKIAYKQDKIALFNKRFESFSSLQKCQAFADLIKTIDNIDDYKKATLFFFGNEQDLEFKAEKVRNSVIQTSIMLQQLSFLFDGVDYNEVGNLFTALKNFVFSFDTTENTEELKTNFINVIDLFIKKYKDAFLDALRTNL